MTPVQVARLALQWYDANKSPPLAVIASTAQCYCYTPEQTAQARAAFSALATARPWKFSAEQLAEFARAAQ